MFPVFCNGGNMRAKVKRIISRVISGAIMCSLGILFLFVEFTDKSLAIFIPAICFAVGAFSFIRIPLDEKSLYYPEKQPTAAMCRKINKAYDRHRKENLERKPVEQELQPVGNIILNTKKFADGINRLIAQTGVSRSEYDEDYSNGEIFRSDQAMVNIGKKFVTYSDIRGNQYLIRSKDIIKVYPIIQDLSVSNCGIYVNTYQNFYIVIDTAEHTYKFFISDYMDRAVIDAFKRISIYLHYDCQIYSYPYPVCDL